MKMSDAIYVGQLQTLKLKYIISNVQSYVFQYLFVKIIHICWIIFKNLNLLPLCSQRRVRNISNNSILHYYTKYNNYSMYIQYMNQKQNETKKINLVASQTLTGNVFLLCTNCAFGEHKQCNDNCCDCCEEVES